MPKCGLEFLLCIFSPPGLLLLQPFHYVFWQNTLSSGSAPVSSTRPQVPWLWAYVCLISYCYYDRLPQTQWLIATQLITLQILEVRRLTQVSLPKIKVWEVCIPFWRF